MDRIHPWTLTGVLGSVELRMLLMVLLGSAGGIVRAAVVGLRMVVAAAVGCEVVASVVVEKGCALAKTLNEVCFERQWLGVLFRHCVHVLLRSGLVVDNMLLILFYEWKAMRGLDKVITSLYCGDSLPDFGVHVMFI